MTAPTTPSPASPAAPLAWLAECVRPGVVLIGLAAALLGAGWSARNQLAAIEERLGRIETRDEARKADLARVEKSVDGLAQRIDRSPVYGRYGSY